MALKDGTLVYLPLREDVTDTGSSGITWGNYDSTPFSTVGGQASAYFEKNTKDCIYSNSNVAGAKTVEFNIYFATGVTVDDNHCVRWVGVASLLYAYSTNRWYSNSQGCGNTSYYTFSRDTWYNVGETYTGSKYQMWVNGSLQSEINCAATVFTTAGVILGNIATNSASAGGCSMHTFRCQNTVESTFPIVDPADGKAGIRYGFNCGGQPRVKLATGGFVI